MIDDRAFPPWEALGDLHQAQLHPRANFVEAHRALLALTVIATDIVFRERDDVRLVLRSRRHVRRRGALVPVRRARARPQHIIRDILLVAQVKHRADTSTSRGTTALQNAPHTPRDAVRLDRDAEVAPVDRPAFRVVRDQHYAARGGERKLVRCEWGEERLECLHHERQVWRGGRPRWREGSENKLCFFCMIDEDGSRKQLNVPEARS